MALFSADVWSIGPEEKIKHEQSFLALNPINGKISGEQSKKYFMKSNLPTPLLGQIWTLSDLDKDGRMTLQEFTIAMHLIQCKLNGIDIPRILPASLKSSTSPSNHSFPIPMQPVNGHFSTMNGAIGNQIGVPMPNPMSGQMMMGNVLPPMQNSGMYGMVGMQQPLNLQPAIGMQTPMMMTHPMGMNTTGNFSAAPGPINRIGSVPTSMGLGTQPIISDKSFTLPSNSSQSFTMPNSSSQGFGNFNNSSVFSRNLSGAPMPNQTSGLDLLSMDNLTGFKGISSQSALSPSLGNISAPNRLRYTQMFKAADHEMKGSLSGEHARQLLIQSNVNPAMLAQIWELSDINKDGCLELDEFIVAMHLIDSVKMGKTLPTVLPVDLIPPHLRNSSGADRGGNVEQMPGTFEDRRKLNWDKGQAELERRRREIQERHQKEKEERERKEWEEKEKKRKLREEAERRRQQGLENERRQKEEMEREQELLRKKMIEQRLAAQLEAERQRQKEWEKRRKEELLNQKEHEENIVNELKSRLKKLKEQLLSETTSRDTLSTSYQQKKAEGLELHAAIEKLAHSRDSRMKDIGRLQNELQESNKKLNNLIVEREKFALELNQRDNTTTSEALGAIKSSVQQMKMGMTRLKKTLISLEAETATVLKESNELSVRHKELKAQLQVKMDENTQLKQQCELKRREEFERKKTVEVHQRKIEEHNRKQLEFQQKLEADLKKQREQEIEAMQKEKLLQETAQKQRREAQNAELAQKQNMAKLHAEAAIYKQQSLLKSKDEFVQKQQDALVMSTKIPPSRPRTRPHGSPVKQPMTTLNVDISKIDNKPNKTAAPFEANFDQIGGNEYASISDFSPNFLNNESTSDRLFDVDFSQDKTTKKPPPRPSVPAFHKKETNFLGDTLKKQQQEKERNKKEEEEKKRAEEAEKKRLEKEKEEIERLKKEQEDKEKEEEQRLQAEREEDEKKRKEADVKRKVEEMQRKRLEKKNATSKKTAPDNQTVQKVATPERPSTAPVAQYVSKTTYKMMYAFEGRNPDELHLEEGDIVQVDESDSSVPPGWLRGSCKGATGLFPANYASKLQNQNFSDYVDLDPRSNVPQESSVTETPKPLAKPQFKPQPKPQSRKPSQSRNTTPTGSRPKSALIPSGKLKGLQPVEKSQPVKQSKTSDLNADLFPQYDFVVGPVVSGPVNEDIYAVPLKSKSTSDLISSQQESIEKNVFPEDMYEVPGEVVAATSSGSIQAVSLYPYHGKKEDHLSFDKNEMINVQQQQDQWWFGESNGKSGWFPKSYVKAIGTSNGQQTSPLQETYSESVESVPADNRGGNLRECIALFDYSGQEGDLSFFEGDVIALSSNEGEWWEGTLNGVFGLFPANYVQMKEQPEVIVNKKPEVAQVSSKYTAGSDTEISFNVGQLVHVLEKNPDGWWKGELQVRGKNKPNGWFPASHVKLMSKGKQETTTSPLSATTPASSEQQHEDIYSVPIKRKVQQEQVLAMFSYTAQNKDELTFYKGSVINVISKDGDWWKGDLNGFIGVFPYNYVQPLRSDMQETTSQWSGAFDSTLLKSMSKAERQRQNHIYELINTEQDYMNDLSLTLEVFYNPLAESGMLSEQELHTVFINWKELIMCNMKFLKALLVRKKMSQTDKIEGIGDIIVEMLPRFSPYIRFCSCMLNACRLLQDKVDKDPEFKQFEKKCAGDPRLKQNLSLSSYLLKPLQRITKYPLVITNIIKYTPEDHFDRTNLEIGLEKAEDLCSQVNEGVRSQESSNRLEWLQERVNLEGLEEKLVFNSQTNCLGQRKYLLHGTLHKHKSNKELKAFLFNDFLLLCRLNTLSKHNNGMFHPDNDVKFTIYKKPIFLNEVIVKNPSDPEVNDTLFHLSHIDRVYSFRSDTKNERNTWVTTIQKESQMFIETEREKRNRATRARSLCDSEVGRLVVTIIEGADLNPSDPTGSSDPYCEVSMGSQEHRTKVIPKDLNPKWNSTMVFNVKDLDKDVLCISVFDRDFFSPNDFLGRTEVSVASIMAEGKGPTTKRLLLHEVATGEIVVTLELQNLKLL